jgi:hypothetical protein
MVRGMPSEGKRDISSEDGQTEVIKAISNLGHTSHTQRSVQRAGGERARRKMVYRGHKEKETGRPLIRRGK